MGMHLGTELKPSVDPSAGRFRFFISYAREDYNLAIAVNNAIQDASGPAAEVFMDVALQYGANFQKEINSRLDKTNVLVVVSSGILKSAFAYPGLELGYFTHLVKESETNPAFPRRIVPIYLEKPPDSIAADQGLNIGISRETLEKTVDEYEAELKIIGFNHPAVGLLRQMQGLIRKVREQQGLPEIPQDETERDLPSIVAKMLRAIFKHLKTTADPEGTLKPQYQITLQSSEDDLDKAGDGQLPGNAALVEVGRGTLANIFGILSTATTWDKFQEQTKPNKFSYSWVDAITKVVRTSLKSLAKDNTQVIVSYDESSAYRVILTTGIRYFNGHREFNIYFVETLRPRYGDPKTTLLFEGLEIACRFRSLFLEEASPFSIAVFGAAKPERLKDYANNMERELNLMLRDSLEVGLDDLSKWLGLLEGALLVRSSRAWLPLNERLRDEIKKIRASEAENLENCRTTLIATLEEIETTMRPLNAEIIAQMGDKLKTDPRLLQKNAP